ncbi:MAG: hypothetical protein ACOYEC_05980 [Christensenellales bacterium]|mgnify:CR=1 FL=1|jgi:hypothetical protein|nr:hypothetical protein [Clostridiales bacterium]
MEQTKSIPAVSKDGDKDSKASYGKFNRLEDLVNAYNSLEAEFTKRSQRLKELEEKQLADNRWETKVNEFMEKYPVAAELTAEIAQEIKDKDLISSENCLEKALLSVLTARYKPPSEQAKDEKVKEEVLKDDKIKDRIINDYLSALNHILPKTLPKGGELPVKAPAKPANIYEAGKAALDMLKEI